MFQKFFATLLTYVIGFQLIASSVPHSSLSMTAWAGSCDSGLQWNELLGRCLSTEEAAKVKEANAQCMSLGTSDAQKQCLNDALLARVQDAENSGEIYAHQKVNSNALSIIIAMAGLVAGVMFLPKKSADCPGAGSAWGILGGSVAIMAGEILSAEKYKSDMKKAEDELKKESDSSSSSSDSSSSDNANATDTQASSFTALLKREDATISAAKFKKNLYMVAMAAYTVSLALTVYEIIAETNPLTGAAAKAIQTCYSALAANSKAPNATYETEQYASNPGKLPSSIALKFITNYFENGQRVDYEYYQLSNLTDKAESFKDIIVSQQEYKRIINGATTTISLDENEKIDNFLLHETKKLTNEDVSFYKIATKLGDSFFVPTAKADMLKGIGMVLGLGGIGAIGASLITVKGKIFEKMFSTSYTRAALAGVLLANSVFMMSHIGKEIKKAEDRKAFIEKLQQEVTASGVAFDCTSSDRSSNTAKPQCYCYLEGGTLNSARSASSVCSAYFGSKPSLSSSKTASSTTSSSNKACMTNSGAYDGSCSCVRTKTCATVSTNVKAGTVPSALLGNLTDTVNGISSGTISGSDINTAQLNALAARAKKLQDNLLAKNPAAATKLSKAQADGRKLVNSIAKDIGNTPALANSNFGSRGDFGSSGSPAQTLEKLKDDLKQEIRSIENPNAGAAAATSGKAGSDLNFDSLLGSEGGVKIEDEKLADVMGSEYDLSQGEINSDSNANIFQILSNRYQRSGMRRLFGGEALVPADKPSDKQISQ